ncbi:lanC-like protein 3 [Asterias rubens]|uniref:lanC-like protein 3 n=1 Tax=Asterias rubens TaxID=7604 RepID=UPI0014556B54|nr:lanC-like protein 3 [Asterias rubens]
MRFFVNHLPDFKDGSEVEIPVTDLQERIRNIVDAIVQNVQPRNVRNRDGGLYVGSAGIAYALWYISMTGGFPKDAMRFLSLSKKYIDVAVEFEKGSAKSMGPSFLCGTCGVHAVGALYYQTSASQSDGSNQAAAQFLQSYANFAAVCAPENFLQCGSDELLVGRAGYLCGVQLLAQKVGKQVLSPEVVHSLCATVVQSGRKYSRRHNSPCPLMYAYYETECLGAAHGLSGILQVLLGFPEYIKSDPSAEKDIRDSVEFLVTCLENEGNIPPALDECGRQVRPAEQELLHWCHGAPGVVYLFAKAYLTWKEEAYLNACKKCSEITWTKGLLKKGPGICHGVAGNGYVFLLMYRLTGEKKYLHQALQFASFMEEKKFRKEASTPDTPYSLFEGYAGTICFLADLMQPDKAEFPFFNVF